MKRSFLILGIVALIAFCFNLTGAKVENVAKSDCCDMTFKVLDGTGQPVQGCTVTIRGTLLECVTNEKGECTLCIPDNLGSSTATANCLGGEFGQSNFIACAQDMVVIYV